MQNILRGIGGPLNLDREDYPWIRFRLSVPAGAADAAIARAQSIVAESPENWSGETAEKKCANWQGEGGPDGVTLHRVGELYQLMYDLIADPKLIPDSCFRASTLPYQANWDEWGRGYVKGARGNTTGGSPKGTPDVLLLPASSRTEALAALKAISIQGEACPDDKEDAPSHFALPAIYKGFPTGASHPAPPTP